MKGKQGANMLNRVATLMGQDQFYFSHYFLIMAIAFLAIAAMLRDQYLAIAGVECSIFFIWNKLKQIKCFYIKFNGKNCFLIRIFAIQTAKKNELSLNQEVPLYLLCPVSCRVNNILNINWNACFYQVMFIMKGLQGSGKTFISQVMQEVYKDTCVCSADHYFMQDGV